MDQQHLEQLLQRLQTGEISVATVLQALRNLPFENLGIARVDHHRTLRQGAPEVVFGETKTPEQLETIVAALVRQGSNVLVTRLDEEKARRLLANFPAGRYDALGRVFSLEQKKVAPVGRGPVLIVCAGTSDLPVAREAAVTARLLGHSVDELVDVGVAGLHRLLAERESLERAAVIIVVAGMEGALPSVVGGMVRVPVIAVPTSVGYGTAFGGVAALLGMLNSCASGVTVVNIDNGFGAAFAAHRINTRLPAE